MNNSTNQQRQTPTLRFTPTAWAKLLYLRDAGDTEIGGFGITSREDLLLIEDVVLVSQQCTLTEVEMDDAAVADFFDEQVDADRHPEEFARIWIHTHPGNSAQPSGIDEQTFLRVFGSADWAVMFIVARGGQTYARLRCNVGPGAMVELPVEVDYSLAFAGSTHEAWQAEYDRCVRRKLRKVGTTGGAKSQVPSERRRLTDPWPAEDASVIDWDVEDWLNGEVVHEDDWPIDPWYDAWLDYVDPSDFPQEVRHADF